MYQSAKRTRFAPGAAVSQSAATKLGNNQGNPLIEGVRHLIVQGHRMTIPRATA